MFATRFLVEIKWLQLLEESHDERECLHGPKPPEVLDLFLPPLTIHATAADKALTTENVDTGASTNDSNNIQLCLARKRQMFHNAIPVCVYATAP